ncbi:MAG: DUF86 domain-containing protein [Spartobacteria bacterium]|nr:DUF86 domain-containing protein [Spartobacteria bacterium]
MDVDDVCLNKGAIIERCIRRIQQEYAADPTLEDFTHLDALTLNIERACQAAIDMAMHVVATRHLGVPQTSAGAFELLKNARIISVELARSLKGMTGFRNVAIHEYQTLDLTVVRWIAEHGTHDWVELCRNLGVTIRP